MSDAWLTSPIQTLLLSYPRSGNSWTRYCLEVLTGRPTHGDTENRPIEEIEAKTKHDAAFIKNHLMCPLCMLIPLDADAEKPVIAHKRHRLLCDDYSADRNLIVIVRDYKEAILRNRCYRSHKTWKLATDWKEKFVAEIPAYLRPVREFLLWEGPKRLVYYEDLIQEPKVTLTSLLKFLKAPTNKLHAFIADIEEHRKRSVALYIDAIPNGSRTRGKDTHMHSKKLTEANQRWILEQVQKFHPPKHLDRYAHIV